MTKLRDLKEGLSSTRKPDLTHVRTSIKVYTARPSMYGDDKYERANYMRPVSPDGYTGRPTRADFERFRAYLRAAESHISQVLDAMELHQSNDPKLEDIDGMIAAAYAPDIDKDVTGKVGPSFLPHVAPACSSIMMAIEQAVLSGLLPADPGCPWKDAECASPTAAKARERWRDESLDAAGGVQ